MNQPKILRNLCVAVRSGNIHQVGAIAERITNSVNQIIRDVPRKGVDGTALLIAIENGDCKMVRTMVEVFGFSLDAPIIDHGTSSTIFAFTVAHCVKTGDLSMLELLIDLRADIFKVGFLVEENGRSFAGRPLEIATLLNYNFCSEISAKALKLIDEACQKKWSRDSLGNIFQSLACEKKAVQSRLDSLSLKKNVMSQKLANAVAIRKKISAVRSNPHFLTADEFEEKKQEFRQMLEMPLKILEDIDDMKASSFYLTPEAIEIFEMRLENIKANFSDRQQKELVFECPGCLLKTCLSKEEDQSNLERLLSCDQTQGADRRTTELQRNMSFGLERIQEKISSAKEQIQELESYIERAKKINSLIRDLEARPDYLSPDEVDVILKKESNIAGNVDTFQKCIIFFKTHPDYVSDDEFDQISRELKNLDV